MAEKTRRERTGPRPVTQFEIARSRTLLTWGPATRTQQQRNEPTFLLQGFKCHLPLRVVIQVTIVQDLVVQCQAAVPETFWNTRGAEQVSKDRCGKGLGTQRAKDDLSLLAPCRLRPRAVAQGSKRPLVPQAPLTLPSAIPDLPEAAALTEPVEALLLDQFEDLRLDLLPQLPGVDTQQSKEKVTAELWKEGRAGSVPPAPAPAPGGHSHDRRGLKVILTHPLGLAQSQDLRVAQAAQFALELIQGAGLGGQGARDLLSDHLHDLRGEEGGGHLTLL